MTTDEERYCNKEFQEAVAVTYTTTRCGRCDQLGPVCINCLVGIRGKMYCCESEGDHVCMWCHNKRFGDSESSKENEKCAGDNG